MSDPLAAPLQQLAQELARGATGGPPDTSDQESAMDDEPFDDEELVDEPFEAKIERARYRPASQSEGSLTEEVLRELNTRPGVLARKVHQAALSGSGEPDLDICAHGRCVKIELKVAGGSRKTAPTPKQHRRLLQWQQAGALVGWATSMREVDEILLRLDDPTYRYNGQAGAPTPAAPPVPED
jgi:hypothetical protein